MIESFAIFFVVCAGLAIALGVFWFCIKYQDHIFGVGVLFLGLVVVYGGLWLLVTQGGGVGALGIFIALFGGLLVWFGVFILRSAQSR